MILGKMLVKLCKERGMTLAALAKESGVKQPTLHGWSTGRSVHNLDDLKKVCDVLEVSFYCILFGEKEPWYGSSCSHCTRKSKN